jgi:hypothetical protein
MKPDAQNALLKTTAKLGDTLAKLGDRLLKISAAALPVTVVQLSLKLWIPEAVLLPAPYSRIFAAMILLLTGTAAVSLLLQMAWSLPKSGRPSDPGGQAVGALPPASA